MDMKNKREREADSRAQMTKAGVDLKEIDPAAPVVYQPAFLHNQRKMDKTMASMHKMWLSRKAEEVKEEIEKREIEKAMRTWNHNRARVEV